MKAILLTAGFGSRLRPLTEVLPKCLLPVNARPLLEYWFSMLTEARITSILMNLHYLPNLMKEWVELTEYAPYIKMVYEESLLGTGGTLLKNRAFVDDEPVMLIHADNLCSVDINAFIDAHKNRPSNTEITMMTFDTQTPETCGIVETDPLGIVWAFYEKVVNPPGTRANAAVYIVEPSIIDFLASLHKPVVDFSTEVLPFYMGRINTFHNANYHRDIGNTESYLAAQIEFTGAMKKFDRNNGWQIWCRDHDDLINNDLVKAIASAYHGNLIDAEELVAGKRDSSILNSEGMKIIYCKRMKPMIECLLELLEAGKLNTSKIMILFNKVPYNFSSIELFKKTQLKSLALCTSSD